MYSTGLEKVTLTEIILGMGSANERRRYIITASLIGTLVDPIARVIADWEH